MGIHTYAIVVLFLVGFLLCAWCWWHQQQPRWIFIMRGSIPLQQGQFPFDFDLNGQYDEFAMVD